MTLAGSDSMSCEGAWCHASLLDAKASETPNKILADNFASKPHAAPQAAHLYHAPL